MNIGIVGGGIFGVSSALELARRGHSITLFERSRVPAADASSTDISKVIRLEYGPATALYAPLVLRALRRWTEIEAQSGQRLLHAIGTLFLASRFSSDSFEGQSVEALRDLGCAPEFVEARDASRRWPQFNWDGLEVGLFNSLGGWLEAASAVSAIADCARAAGASILEDQPAEAVEDNGTEARIHSGGRTQSFDQVLVCAGPWVNRLLPDLKPQVRVTRQQISLYRPLDPTPLSEPHFPVWIYDMREEGFYGFPANAEGIVKVSLHRRSESVDPDISRVVDQEFLELSRRFVAKRLPALPSHSPVTGRVCLYTNSTRGELVFDRVPGTQRLFVAGLGSGHGFKFGPVLGELAADLLEHDQVPVEFRLRSTAGEEVW